MDIGAGRIDRALGIAAAGKLVAVVGQSSGEFDDRHFTVRVYAAATGDLLFGDNAQGTANGNGDQANAVAVKGSRVFAAGRLSNADAGEFTIRTYSAK